MATSGDADLGALAAAALAEQQDERRTTSAGMSGMIQAWVRNHMRDQPFITSSSSRSIAAAVAVDEQDDGEADADLGGGHGDDEQGEDLAGDGAVAWRRRRPG